MCPRGKGRGRSERARRLGISRPRSSRLAKSRLCHIDLCPASDDNHDVVEVDRDGETSEARSCELTRDALHKGCTPQCLQFVHEVVKGIETRRVRRRSNFETRCTERLLERRTCEEEVVVPRG